MLFNVTILVTTNSYEHIYTWAVQMHKLLAKWAWHYSTTFKYW